MQWQTVVSILSVLITGGLGLATLVRGRNADKAVDTATNIQTTFNATNQLVKNLWSEVRRQGELLQKCEEEHESKDSQIRDMRLTIHTLELKVETLEREKANGT